ncbi:hypothetical protein AMJ82_11435 [candidate division TA06 bacterium SM23_40]|nr:MAG: hypothetical protein AMJ82_11435 [candidate division TA06 bacterium SM23_40]
MTGLEGISPGRHIDLMVYSTVGQDGGLRDPGNPLLPWDNHPARYRTGADLKWGVLSNVTADLTVNPDFSQVESDVDQIDINNRFPLYFPEKRPFFLEGSDMFETSRFRILHTRRIADPMAAGKVTGKVGPMTFGLLSAYDRGVEAADTSFVGILRTKADLFENSWMGLMVADREQEDGHSRVLSVDGQLRIAENYHSDFQVAQTWTKDEDGEYSDPAFGASVGRFGRNFNTSIWYTDIRPGVEFGTGYLSRPGISGPGAWAGYTFRPEGDFLVWWEPAAWVDLTYDDEGRLMEEYAGPEISMQLRGPTWVHLELVRFGILYRERRHRGHNVSFSVENRNSGKICGGFWIWAGNAVYYDLDDDDVDESFKGFTQNGGVWCELRPTDRFSLEASLDRDNMFRTWGGEEAYDEIVARAKATYHFNREFSFRGVVQENTQDESLAMQLLLSYVYVPGSVLYLGLNEEYDHGSSFERDGRTVFAKVSYLFRL